MLEGEDYYYNEMGLMVLTAKYLLKRGYCCGKKCTNCPYEHVNVVRNDMGETIKPSDSPSNQNE